MTAGQVVDAVEATVIEAILIVAWQPVRRFRGWRFARHIRQAIREGGDDAD